MIERGEDSRVKARVSVGVGQGFAALGRRRGGGMERGSAGERRRRA